MATIYAYTSNNNHLEYTVTMTRSGNTVTIKVDGTLYGNGSSADSTSSSKLYAQLRYNVSPANTTGTSTYVTDYGTLLSWTSSTVVDGYTGTNANCMIASNTTSDNLPPLTATGFPTSGRHFTITYTSSNGAAVSYSNVALFLFKSQTSTTAPSTSALKAYTFIGKKDSSISTNKLRYYTQSLSVAAATYTVAYNANGHGTAPSSQTKTYGTNLTLQSFIADVNGTTNTVTITGNKGTGDAWSGSNGSATWRPVYSQTYWNTNSGGTGTNYSSGGTYSTNAGTTLYAIWKTTNTGLSYTLPTGTPTKNSTTTNTLTVSYNANGGTSTPASQTSSKTVTYSFKGWFTASSGGTQRTTSSRVTAAETVYAQFNSTTGSQAAITLRPAITHNNTTPTSYKVTFNPNNGSTTKTDQTANVTRTWTFNGWHEGSASGTSHNASSSFTPSATVTMYAGWNTSDSTGSVTMPTTAECTRVGFTLLGFSESSTATTATWSPGASYTPTAAKTVYAVWSRNNYTITFNANGGSVSETSRNVAYANQITNLPTPVRTGYNFKGWSLRFNGTSSTAINYGRSFMFTNLLSIHFDAFSDSWSSSIGRLISCTETGGFNIEDNNSHPAFIAHDTSEYKYAVASTSWSGLDPTVWHSFDLIFNGSSIIFYIDGVQESSVSFTNGNTIHYNSANSIWLGAEAIGTQSGNTSPYFNGEIANIVIKNNSTITSDTTYNSFSMPAQNVTLYAVWEKMPSITNIYHNGSWQAAPVYIYQNGSWVDISTVIKVYNGTKWTEI